MEPGRRDRVNEPLVVHVGFGPLAPLVDADRLTAAAGRPVDVRAVPYDLSHAEQTRRERDPHAPDLAHGEPPLGDELRTALADAEVMLTLNAPLDAPPARTTAAVGPGDGFRASASSSRRTCPPAASR